jgi:hypothetical protein
MNQLITTCFALLTMVIISCKKDTTPTPAVVNEPTPAGSVLATGSFISSAHTTSGTVKVTRDAANKTRLVFENFRTEDGPDLRVWLSPNNTGSPYQEAGILKALTGNFSYELNSSFDHITNNRVLIWCEDFSVLFGYAVLQ